MSSGCWFLVRYHGFHLPFTSTVKGPEHHVGALRQPIWPSPCSCQLLNTPIPHAMWHPHLNNLIPCPALPWCGKVRTWSSSSALVGPWCVHHRKVIGSWVGENKCPPRLFWWHWPEISARPQPHLWHLCSVQLEEIWNKSETQVSVLGFLPSRKSGDNVPWVLVAGSSLWYSEGTSGTFQRCSTEWFFFLEKTK